MIKDSLVLLRPFVGAAALIAGVLAAAPAVGQDGNVTIGAPQLRDFQIEPKQRIVTQPAQPAQPAAPRPQPVEQPSSTATTTRPAPQPTQQRPAPQTRSEPQRSAPPPASTTTPTAPPPALPVGEGGATATTPPLPMPEPAPLPAPAAPATSSGDPLSNGIPLWVYFLAFVTVGLLGYGYFLKRQAAGRRALAVAAAAPAAPVVETPRAPAGPRPDPVPRPWLDIALVPEKAHVDLDQSVIEFELTVRNTGGSVAKDVKLQARFFCSTDKQDQELAAYFKAKPGDYKTLSMPDIPAGGEIVMKGSVDITRDRISALKVADKLLFVPVIGVNAFYGWGTSRSGQTSKSFVIGRQPDNDNEKMGPFRLDLGARVYRTIGQRPHKVSKRV
ncbi:MAG: hypothetical protein ACK4SZ_09870 [Allosphingosinicella sp.]|uniref:hypothetical protein n=1 Tax=Allosphingosinicella sp. TaxID=2823234 RepID=UPI00393ED3B0